MICKGIFIFLLIIILVKVGLAFSVSPAEIYFDGKINEKICQEIKIFEEAETVIIEDKWAESKIGEKNINLYNLESEKFEIFLDYPKIVDLQNGNKITICLSGKKSGEYFGILLLHPQEQPVGIGIWMKVNLMKVNSQQKDASSISGKVTSEEKVGEKIENTKLVIIFSMILIILILIFVYILLNNSLDICKRLYSLRLIYQQEGCLNTYINKWNPSSMILMFIV